MLFELWCQPSCVNLSVSGESTLSELQERRVSDENSIAAKYLLVHLEDLQNVM
jgi:hypothetical protein